MTLRLVLRIALLCASGLAADRLTAQAPEPNQPQGGTPPQRTETLHYSVDWHFVRAGQVVVKNTGIRRTQMNLSSTGLVSRMFRVEDEYAVTRDARGCSETLSMKVQEGRRLRDVHATFDTAARKATFVERDLVRNSIVSQKQSDIPGCVYDLLGGLDVFRNSHPKPGQSWNVLISDGKKTANVHVVAEDKEIVKTPLGQFQSTRYEAFVFGGVLYGRNGRLFAWITDDDARLPIQFRIQLPFYVGTVTLQLEKVERP